MKKRLFALCMAMCMIATILFPNMGMSYAADNSQEAYDGYVYFTVEKSTLGQGLVVEPVKVGYYNNENLDKVVQRVLADKAIYCDGYYGSYLQYIDDGGEPAGWTTADIPEIIADKLAEANVEITSRQYEKEPGVADKNKLGEFDYSTYSGWMFALNDAGLNEGSGSYYPAASDNASDYIFDDGDVIRLQFSLYGYGQDTNTYWTDDTLIDFPSKDLLIIATAEYEGNKTDEAYINAIDVLADWDATEEEIDEAYDGLTAKLATPTDPEIEYKDYEKALIESLKTVRKMVDEPANASISGEWVIIGSARFGYIDPIWYNSYLEKIKAVVKENNSATLSSTKSTENSRVVLALTSLGCNPADIEGFNLIEPLYDKSYVVKQGINGAIYALLAIDSAKYEVPSNATASRDALVEYILSKELSDGGFGITNAVDVDITAMAIQSLAPYYNSNDKVKAAVDKAVDLLSKLQNEDGTFSENGTAEGKNCESTAQVLIALSILGIDADSDERFVKNEYSVVDGLLSFFDEDAGMFMHTTTTNLMATEQAICGLVAYSRFCNDNNSFYDMTDAKDLLIGKDFNTDDIEDTIVSAPRKKGYLKAAVVNNGVKLTWKKTANAKSYKVYRKAGKAKKWSKIATVKKNRTYLDKKVKNGTKYTYKIVVVGGKPGSSYKTATTYYMKKASVTSAKKKNGSVYVKWRKNTKASGYQVQYAAKSSMKKAKLVTVKGAKKVSLKLKATKARRYVRVRSYIKKNGKKYYSAWSKTIKVTSKKK